MPVGPEQGEAATQCDQPINEPELLELDDDDACLPPEAIREMKGALVEHHTAEETLPLLAQEESQEAKESNQQKQYPSSSSKQKPPVDRTRNKLAVGLIGCGRAPERGKGSICYFCGSGILKGQVRFEYRFSSSGKIPRYIHPECCVQIPADARQVSIDFLTSFCASHQEQRGIQSHADLLRQGNSSLSILRSMQETSTA